MCIGGGKDDVLKRKKTTSGFGENFWFHPSQEGPTIPLEHKSAPWDLGCLVSQLW